MDKWFDYIVYHMQTQPEKPALVMENRVVTYGMFKVGMERCARRIANLNCARGEAVAVLYKDPIRHLTLCLALYRIGIPSLSLGYDHVGIKALNFGTLLGDAEAKNANFSSARLIDVTDKWFATDMADGAALTQGFTDPSEVCRLSLTSGTTGEQNHRHHC